MSAAAGDGPSAPSRPSRAIPVSTYRLQLNPHFTLKQALDVVPYLDALGISHVYASPFLKARPGSEHGYDITDHNALNPEIGDWDDFVRFTDALRARDMGLILDFVPNHMGIGKSDNAWWLDVLEWGQASIYADYFDIDWTPFKPELKGRLLLPLLGDHYGAVLLKGELALRYAGDDGTLSVWYHEHRLPLRPRSYAAVLRRGLANSGGALSPNTRATLERLAQDFDRVRRVGRHRREDMRRRMSALKAEMRDLCRSGDAARFIAEATDAFNGTPGQPESFRALHLLLERQHYRIAFWRAAADEINYRRFFNINELAGIRMENRVLFEVAHRLVGRMIREGRLQGLRLDHVDGLFDPEAYCRRLQAFAHEQARERAGDRSRVYLVIEKILARHEALRPGWPIAGTTGYEFANLVNGLFVHPDGEAGCEEVYRAFAGSRARFDDVAAAAKDVVIETLLAGELNVLANELDRISERHWDTRDYTMHRLRDALKAVVCHFPVYRTYVTGRRIAPEDRRDIEWAVVRARKGWRGADRAIFDFVEAALTGDLARRGKPFRRADVLRFAMRFQQYTGPIMAKAMEDTAFYRYPRLISLNEVGGDPRQFGVSVEEFHAANRYRAQHWPHSLLATATHDTKRGEDARLRIDALSEMPGEWKRRVARWSEIAHPLRHDLDGAPAPSRSDEFMIYQTLIGAWPAEFVGRQAEAGALARFTERIESYAVKAVREAKLESSWDNPNEAYEAACIGFIRGLLDATCGNGFLAECSEFAARVALIGAMSSISQTVLRLTVPGVPDCYQGTELWDLTLVDPDNRGLVDFARRRRVLGETRAPEASGLEALLGSWHDARIKFAILCGLLRLRRSKSALFLHGDYEPLQAEGARAKHLVAFMRQGGAECVLVLAGRLFLSLLGADAQRYDAAAWLDTAVASPIITGTWRDALSGDAFQFARGEPIRLSTVLSRLPATVLVREEC